MRALLVAVFLVLPGCILGSGPDNVRLVCERRTGSPWHPYPPDVLEGITTVEEGLAPAERLQAFVLLADQILTLRSEPYERFEAVLREEGDGLWRFEANATWRAGEESGEDGYLVTLLVRDGAVRNAREEHGVPAPERLAERASVVLARDADATELVAGKPDIVSATWHEGAPSCIDVERGCEGCPPTHAWVNVVRGQVVLVTDENAAPR